MSQTGLPPALIRWLCTQVVGLQSALVRSGCTEERLNYWIKKAEEDYDARMAEQQQRAASAGRELLTQIPFIDKNLAAFAASTTGKDFR